MLGLERLHCFLHTQTHSHINLVAQAWILGCYHQKTGGRMSVVLVSSEEAPNAGSG